MRLHTCGCSASLQLAIGLARIAFASCAHNANTHLLLDSDVTGNPPVRLLAIMLLCLTRSSMCVECVCGLFCVLVMAMEVLCGFLLTSSFVYAMSCGPLPLLWMLVSVFALLALLVPAMC